MPLRHYTDDVGRKGIQEAGLIFPGRDGRVYLTSDDYENGQEALWRLALPRVPTAYLQVPEGWLVHLSEPRRVAPRFGQPGGGTEQHVEHAVDASGLPWTEIES